MLFWSFSFDSLISRASRDVFSGFLARSVQEFRPIILDGPKKWPVRDLTLHLILYYTLMVLIFVYFIKMLTICNIW